MRRRGFRRNTLSRNYLDFMDARLSKARCFFDYFFVGLEGCADWIFVALLRKVLAGNPQMNVIFGATSVGKTALLRQVLAGDDFYVIKFDLRISGFADLRTLYLALCEQFKNLFEEVIIFLPNQMV
jgi:hypothetical protein